MLHIDIGLSSIRASQQALSAISNNIANAGTEGYHRQRVELIDRPPITVGPLQIGSGVEVVGLTRLRDTATEGALISTNSLHSESDTYLRILGQIEAALLPSQGSLVGSVSNFFNEIEQLAAQPSTVTIRDAAIAAAEDVVNRISQLETRLNQLRTGIAVAISEDVDAVDEATAGIAELNRQIRIVTHSGGQPNTLLDQRDRLVTELSKRVDISLQSFLVLGSPLVAASGAVIVAEESTNLIATTSTEGRAVVQTPDSESPVTPSSGSLAGLLAGQETIDSIQNALHDWATQFVQAIDQIHATGLGHNQQESFSQGSRSVADSTIPLAGIDSPYDIESGRLFITTTETSTGLRTTHQIDIDPATDSLDDVLAAIDAIPNLSANYQPESNRVTLRSDDGYAVDFAGGIDVAPLLSGLTGTATPRLSGFPDAFSNNQWTATIVGSGDVGTTPGLSVEITDTATGEAIQTIDIGSDYLAGEKIVIANGIEVSFSAGTVANGETFTFDSIGDPDETGILVALGLNTLFSGDVSSGLEVHDQVLLSPLNFAASRTGDSADSSNLNRIIQLRDTAIFDERDETTEERLASLVTATAFRIEAEEASFEFLNEQKLRLENDRDSVSGVDPNEELLNMLEFQRQFQAASRFISVVDEALDEMMRLIG